MTLSVWTLWVLLVSGLLGLIGFAAYASKNRRVKRRTAVAASKIRLDTRQATAQSGPATTALSLQISYAASNMVWSGSTSGTMPFKTLTYKQYECLEDARYGFKIVGVTPTERKKAQPYRTRAHGLKTVASLQRHGFLQDDDTGGHVITDHGLHALEVCLVRY